MIISKNKKYYEDSFKNEEEIESIVLENSEYLFGPSSFTINKSLIKTFDGFGTIPDAFALSIDDRKWYIVEVELAHHSFWNHIVPQVTKQILAAKQPKSRMLLIEKAFELYKSNTSVREIFDLLEIKEADAFKIIQEIVNKDPIIALPIDNVTNDMYTWASEQKSIVKIWTIKKYREVSNPSDIIFEFPSDYKASVDTEEETDDLRSFNKYDVTIEDLVTSKILSIGEVLYLKYKPKNGEQKSYSAEILDDYTIRIDSETFNAPSYAALYCINKSGSERKTVNGWTSFRNSNGKLLSELREEYLLTNKRDSA
jgi:hypothetical protein